MFTTEWIFLVLLLVATAGVIVHLLAASAFRAQTEALFARLNGVSAEVADPSGTPAIVQAYGRRAAPGLSVPATVRLRQSGAVRLNSGGAWRPFSAEQTISVGVPGFVWLADIRMGPFVSARVVDAYVDGRGLLEARLFGSVPLATSEGPQIDRSELMRYLAELVWVPHALLYNPHLRWRQIDQEVVEVSADSTEGPARVRLVFENGDIARVEADDRPCKEGNRTVPRRWIGRFFDYGELSGCRIPRQGEVSWVLDDAPFIYWRGEVTAFETAQSRLPAPS